MRQLKWAGLAFFLGSLVMLSPDYSPAQGGKKGKGGFGGGDGGGFGKGGFGKGGFGGGDGGGKGGFGGGQGGFGGGQPGGFGGGQPGGFGNGGYGNPQGNYGGQPGGFGGGGKGGFGGGGQGGFGGGQPGGFGGQPGGFGGQPGGGMGGGRGGDPAALWDRFSQGQDSINLNDPQNERMRGMMERMNVPVPPNGVVTREMFITARNTAGGGPMVVTMGGGPGGPMGGGFGGPGGGGPGGRDRAMERLTKQDADGDGRVSRAEADRDLQQNFDRIDLDRDGFVTLDEYRGYYANQQGGGGGNRGQGGGGMGPGGFGPGGEGNWNNWNGEPRNTEEVKPVAMRYGHLPKDLPQWFDRDDANKDGQVALHEWLKAKKNMDEFIAYDLNGDGLITADELLRFNFKQSEDAKIAAYNDPDNPDNPKPSFAMKRGGGGGGFSLPGSTPPSGNGFERPQGKGDRPQGKGDRPQGKNNNDERAPDGGNGGPNPFRKSKN